MRSAIAASSLLALVTAGPALAGTCPGNPTALGISRTIVVDPKEHPLLGGHNYRESLPLNDREVVLTFDDGPLPPSTIRILDDLSAECVKATFFLVGRMARSFPHIVQRIYDEGHTVGNHSQNHPLIFNRAPVERTSVEIEDGFASITAALGEGRTVAPFFRIPGLLRQEAVENYMISRGVQVWSVDAVADDWHRHVTYHDIAQRAVSRLEEKGRGILLLHDIKPQTALAVPIILAELKARGFKIVHVVPAGPGRPKTETSPEQWSVRHAPVTATLWPTVRVTAISSVSVLETPSPESFGIVEPVGPLAPITILPALDRPRSVDISHPAAARWPAARVDLTASGRDLLPAPGGENFRYARVWRGRVAKADLRRPPLVRQDPAGRREGPPLVKRDGFGRRDPMMPRTAVPAPLPHAPRELAPPGMRPPRPVGHDLSDFEPPPPPPPPRAPVRNTGFMDRFGGMFR